MKQRMSNKLGILMTSVQSGKAFSKIYTMQETIQQPQHNSQSIPLLLPNS